MLRVGWNSQRTRSTGQHYVHDDTPAQAHRLPGHQPRPAQLSIHHPSIRARSNGSPRLKSSIIFMSGLPYPLLKWVGLIPLRDIGCSFGISILVPHPLWPVKTPRWSSGRWHQLRRERGKDTNCTPRSATWPGSGSDRVRRRRPRVGLAASFILLLPQRRRHSGGMSWWRSLMRFMDGLSCRFQYDVSSQKLRSPITEGRVLFCYQNVRERRRRVGVSTAKHSQEPRRGGKVVAYEDTG